MNKKGFTIVEIVIALTIISIVSLTTTSLVITSQNISQKTRDQFFALDLKNNSLAVFTSLSDENKPFAELCDIFAERMNKALDYDMSDAEKSENSTVFQLNFNSNWTQLSGEKAKNNCTIKLTAASNTLFFDITINTYNFTISDRYQIYAEGL